ncbi:MAG: Tn3 family transposase [Acetobacteraceae bacterium]|nr:Tn3 family transposase [Acetobacteraceae bacterium]
MGWTCWLILHPAGRSVRTEAARHQRPAPYLLPGKGRRSYDRTLVGGTIDVQHVAAPWDEPLCLAVSIGAGTVTGSAMLQRLAAYPRQNGLAVGAARGRLPGAYTVTLEWISGEAGLNKVSASTCWSRGYPLEHALSLRGAGTSASPATASGTTAPCPSPVSCGR